MRLSTKRVVSSLGMGGSVYSLTRVNTGSSQSFSLGNVSNYSTVALVHKHLCTRFTSERAPERTWVIAREIAMSQHGNIIIEIRIL